VNPDPIRSSRIPGIRLVFPTPAFAVNEGTLATGC
jgi:hypothetical protein